MATVDIYNMAQTWNAGATTFTAIKMDVTDTASAAASKLLDLLVGGSSRFSVGKAGDTVLASAASFGWSTDVKLWRDDANVLALRNGTSGQSLRLYNTFTDGANYERGTLFWEGGVLKLIAQNAGTGSARSIQIISGPTQSVSINSGSTEVARLNSAGLNVYPSGSLAAGGNANHTLKLTSSGLGLYAGSGAPTISAAKGSIYMRSDGSGTTNRAYINTDGGTTWTALTTVA